MDRVFTGRPHPAGRAVFVAGEGHGRNRQPDRHRLTRLYLLLREQTARHLDADTAGAIVAGGNRGRLADDALTPVAREVGPSAGSCPESSTAIHREVRAVLSGFLSLAVRLDPEGLPAGGAEPLSATEAQTAALRCLTRWGGTRPPAATQWPR